MKKITLFITLVAFSFGLNAQVLTEGFEAGIPAGWSQTQITGTTDWTTSANNQDSSVQPRTGVAMAYFYVGNYANRTRLETPALDLTTLTTPVLTFYYTNATWGGDIEELRVFVKNSAGGTWSEVAVYTANAEAWTEVNIILPNPSNDYYIAFEAKANWGRGATIDDVLVDELTGCLPPGSLSALPTSTTATDLSWIAAGPEADWTYEYGITGYAQGAAQIGGASIMTETASITGLTSGTVYDFYVQANCGGGNGDSTYTGPFTWTQPDTGEACGTAIVAALEADCGTATPITLDFSMTTTEGGGSCDSFNNIGYWVTTTTDAAGGLTINASGAVDLVIFSDCTGTEDACYDASIDPSIDIVLSPNTQYFMYFWVENGGTTSVDICISPYTPLPAPDCATAPITPSDGETGVEPFDAFTLSWTAPASGATPTSYNVYAGTMMDGSDQGLVVNTTDTFTDVNVGGYDVTIYWSVFPLNGVVEATGCDTTLWSFTTASPPPAPDCAMAPITPADMATGVEPYGNFTLSWTAPVSGATPTSYNVYAGTMMDGSDQGLVVNTTDTFTDVNVGGYDVTIYWSVFPVNGTIEAIGCGTALWSFTTASIPSPPANDDLCNAILLALDIESSGGAYTNESATTEASESGGSCWFDGGAGENLPSESVWFSFVAPSSGDVVINTVYFDGTLADTQLALYSLGGDCADLTNLTELGCDEDDDLDLDDNGTVQAYLAYSGLTGGTTYYVQVDGWGADIGPFDISVFDQVTLSTDEFQIATDELFTYYPNPVDNTLTLKAQNNIQNISVFNMLGQVVINTTPNAIENNIDMSTLQSGAYFVKVTIQNTTKTIRIIKQ